MDIYKKVEISVGESDLLLEVGQPSSEDERREMFSLRYDVYAKKGYINPEAFENDLERDLYDEIESTTYYTARINNTLVGSLRTIFKTPLPTREAYDFDEPELITSLDPEKRCEIGRLIIRPYNAKEGIHPPRGVVLLFLLESVIQDSIEKNILGGYSFIKASLQKKLHKRNIPFHEIDEYNLNIDQDNTLYNYFTQKDDPVIPIYFQLKEAHDYIEKYTNSWLLFRNKNQERVQLRNWAYNMIKFFS